MEYRDLILLFVCLGVFGCGSGQQQQTETVPDTPQEEQEEATQQEPVELEDSQPEPEDTSWPNCSALGVERLASRDHYIDELREWATRRDMSNPDVQIAAARALALIGEPEGRDALEKVFLREHHDNFILASLVLAGSAEAEQMAIERMRNASQDELVLLSVGFERSQNQWVIQHIRTFLNSGSAGTHTQWNLRISLARMGEQQAIGELRTAFQRGGLGIDDLMVAAMLICEGDANAIRVIENILLTGSENEWDIAGWAYGFCPDDANLDILVTYHDRAQDEFSRMWLGYAIVRYCDELET